MFAHAAHTTTHGFGDSLSGFFARVIAAFAGVAEATRVYNELSRLSPDALKARGLVREDIARMTFQALANATDR
jgi:uncharacterized protein YjiS (DUF1127 family)